MQFNVSHKVRLVRDTFTDDGLAGRDCFDRTPLPVSVDVDIDVDFPEVEIREVTTSGSTGPTAIEIAAAVLAAAQVTPVYADVRSINATPLEGTGVAGSEWGPA